MMKMRKKKIKPFLFLKNKVYFIFVYLFFFQPAMLCAAQETSVIIPFTHFHYADRVLLGKSHSVLVYNFNLLIKQQKVKSVTLTTVLSHYPWNSPFPYKLILWVNHQKVAALTLNLNTTSHYHWKIFLPYELLKSGENIIEYQLEAESFYFHSRSFKDWVVIHASSNIRYENLLEKIDSGVYKPLILKKTLDETSAGEISKVMENVEEEESFIVHYHGTIIFIVFIIITIIQVVISLYAYIRQKLTKK